MLQADRWDCRIAALRFGQMTEVGRNRKSASRDACRTHSELRRIRRAEPALSLFALLGPLLGALFLQALGRLFLGLLAALVTLAHGLHSLWRRTVAADGQTYSFLHRRSIWRVQPDCPARSFCSALLPWEAMSASNRPCNSSAASFTLWIKRPSSWWMACCRISAASS